MCYGKWVAVWEGEKGSGYNKSPLWLDQKDHLNLKSSLHTSAHSLNLIFQQYVSFNISFSLFFFSFSDYKYHLLLTSFFIYQKHITDHKQREMEEFVNTHKSFCSFFLLISLLAFLPFLSAFPLPKTHFHQFIVSSPTLSMQTLSSLLFSTFNFTFLVWWYSFHPTFFLYEYKNLPFFGSTRNFKNIQMVTEQYFTFQNLCILIFMHYLTRSFNLFYVDIWTISQIEKQNLV